MALPLLHELTRPITLCLPSPRTALHAHDDPGVCTRDYAYVHDAVPAQAPTHRAFSNPGAPFSLQSRTSTNILQYNLVSARNGNGNGNGRSSSGSSGSGMDALPGLWQMIGTLRPQSRRERSRVREKERERTAREQDAYNPPAQAPELVRRERERESPLERQRRSGAGMPLERLFKKRFRTRQSGSSGGIPDIMVESPRPLLPLPEFYLTTPSAVGIANEVEQQLPAGFVPMSAADPPHDFGATKAKGPRYSYEVAPIPPGVEKRHAWEEHYAAWRCRGGAPALAIQPPRPARQPERPFVAPIAPARVYGISFCPRAE
ncbi:predicted protein [Postia placenta Mad-698-R]|nr:predicted protein [Postia placenta Mad-698-R]